jgi:hypothetical protein
MKPVVRALIAFLVSLLRSRLSLQVEILALPALTRALPTIDPAAPSAS